MNSYLTTREVATHLNVTETTIYSYIQQGKIIPFNLEDWKIDGEYRFDLEELERVKKATAPPGLTTKQVAAILNVSRSTVTTYIKEAKIPATLQVYKGRERYFIDEEKLEGVKGDLEKEKLQKNTSIYNKILGVALFQLLKKETEEKTEYARVMELVDGKAMIENGEKVVLEEDSGYKKVYDVTKPKYIQRKGYVTFEFPKPAQVQSSIFKLIDELYKHVGHKNMKMTVTEKTIIVQVKSVLLPFTKNTHIDFIDLLKAHIKEGEVKVRRDDVFLETRMEWVQTYVDKVIKERLQEIAKGQDVTIDELVAKLLEDAIQYIGRSEE